MTLIYLIVSGLLHFFGGSSEIISKVNAEFGTQMTGAAIFLVGFYCTLLLDANIARGSD